MQLCIPLCFMCTTSYKTGQNLSHSDFFAIVLPQACLTESIQSALDINAANDLRLFWKEHGDSTAAAGRAPSPVYDNKDLSAIANRVPPPPRQGVVQFSTTSQSRPVGGPPPPPPPSLSAPPGVTSPKSGYTEESVSHVVQAPPSPPESPT